MPRALHRWTPPERPNPNLSIRICVKCSLTMHSRHESLAILPGERHWKEYYTAESPDVRLLVMPECARESVDVS